MPLANKPEDSNLHLVGAVMGEKESAVHMVCTAKRMKHVTEAESFRDRVMMGASLEPVEAEFKCWLMAIINNTQVESQCSFDTLSTPVCIHIFILPHRSSQKLMGGEEQT